MDTMKESQESLPMDSFAEDDLSELLSSLQQILEDIKANDTIYTILELLREDYGDLQEFPLSFKIYRVDKSKERIIQEIQRYIQENRQEKEIDNSIKETNSLDIVYLVSTELQGIVGKPECTGREVVKFICILLQILSSVWKYIANHNLYDPENPSSLILDEVFTQVYLLLYFIFIQIAHTDILSIFDVTISFFYFLILITFISTHVLIIIFKYLN